MIRTIIGPMFSRKCVSLHERVMTTTGPIRAFDVRVGTELMHPAGYPTKVVSVVSGSEVMINIYTAFSSHLVSANHLVTAWANYANTTIGEIEAELLVGSPYRAMFAAWDVRDGATFSLQDMNAIFARADKSYATSVDQVRSAPAEIMQRIYTTTLVSRRDVLHHILDSDGKKWASDNIIDKDVLVSLHASSRMGMKNLALLIISCGGKIEFIGMEKSPYSITFHSKMTMMSEVPAMAMRAGRQNYVGFELQGDGHFMFSDDLWITHNTSTMIAEVERYTYTKKRCVIVQSQLDKPRFDGVIKNGGISGHDGIEHYRVPILVCDSLASIDAKIREYDVIGIDEIQFFADADKYIDAWADLGKIIIASGLDGNFRQEPFGKIANVIAISDKVEKLNAICMLCKDREASMTIKITDDGKPSGEANIGASEKYVAVCRQCRKDKARNGILI